MLLRLLVPLFHVIYIVFNYPSGLESDNPLVIVNVNIPVFLQQTLMFVNTSLLNKNLLQQSLFY